MSNSRHIQKLLELTSNYDKDERYMATSDLCTELENDVKMDVQLERKICTAVLKQLDDTSNDVQSVAVKCLSILVKKVEEAQVSDICSKLCNLILNGGGDLRDIYSIGLKTCLEDLPEAIGPLIAMQLTSRLLGGVRNDEAESIKLECLDILTDLIKFYGFSMTAEHSNISTATLEQLSHSTPVIRKRATACLGRLSTVVSDELLDRILKTLLEQIENPTGSTDQRTIIQTIGSIARMVGYRMGSHLSRIIPLFLTALKDPEDEDMQNEQADELRENILHAFESFVTKCPHEVSEHVPKIQSAMLSFLQYDPNYQYDDEEDEEDEDEMDEDDDEYGDFDVDDYSDEDDTSWKVRRAALKVLSAIIVTRPQKLSENYKDFAALLLDRFKERDENVKWDVVECYTHLLRSVGKLTGTSAGGDSNSTNKPEQVVSTVDPDELIQMVLKDVPTAVKNSVRILKKDKKSIKAKVSLFKMFQVIILILQGGLDDHISTLTPFIVESCNSERDSSLTLETLNFLQKLMQSHAASKIQPEVEQLTPPILKCAGAEWYKIVSQALCCVTELVAVFRPGTTSSKSNGTDVEMVDSAASDFDATKYVKSCYDAVLPRLETHDIDTEIKESAIIAMGAIFARLGDNLGSELDKVLGLLQERLGNEITRVAALRSIQEIAASPLKLNLDKVLVGVVSDLVQFMRQQSRTLKQQTLLTLDALVKSKGSSMDAKLFNEILEGTSRVIEGSDLYLSQMCVVLTISILDASNGSTVQEVNNITIPIVMKLICSGLLQSGKTLDAVLDLFVKLVEINSPTLGFDEILALLVAPTQAQDAKLSRTAIQALSRCVAATLLACKDAGKQKQTTEKIVQDVENGLKSNPGVPMHLALLSLGEVGRDLDISDLAPNGYEAVLSCLDNKTCSEDIKSAAATSLGNITLGNMTKFLPSLMKQLEDRSEQAQQYLLLSSLREVIVRHSSSKATGQSVLPVDQILPVLERHCKSEEEGVRNMVAECLGKLAFVDPEKMVPYLVGMVNGQDSHLVRCTCVTSLKFASTGANCQKLLRQNIGSFVKLLSDEDILVRRAAILAFNSIAHHQPIIIHDVAQKEIIPVLFNEMHVKPELKEKVNLGPFQHIVDKGLPLRKGAFSCMLTMFDTMPDVIPVLDFLPHLAKGLGDVDDVAMQCHQIVAQIATQSPHLLLGDVSVVLDPLTKTLNKNPKEAKGSATNHANDVIRSALRALDAIASIPEAAQNKVISDVVAICRAKAHLLEMMNSDHLKIAKVKSSSSSSSSSSKSR